MFLHPAFLSFFRFAVDGTPIKRYNTMMKDFVTERNDMSSYLYFDHAATAMPCARAIQVANDAFGTFGNPSSLHGAGLAAKRMVDTAREQVARALRCESGQIVFVSSGT